MAWPHAGALSPCLTWPRSRLEPTMQMRSSLWMTMLKVDWNGRRYTSQAAVASDLGIPLSFDGDGPVAFGAALATSEPLTAPGFSGQVKAGASCNASVLTFAPHGNGTHTESIAHLLSHGPPVPALLNFGWFPAWIATVALNNDAIEPWELSDALIHAHDHGCLGLIVRTRPNNAEKITRRYSTKTPPRWLARRTAEAVASAGIEHLAVDLPSLDRLDDPELPAHRAFFGLARESGPRPRRRCTVTEFIYVPDELHDGLYLLDLQVPRWQLEAVPSRPLVVPAKIAEG